jgi:membrane-bound serine protease (ClpP class)
LALVAFNILPVNFLGVALIIGAIILFVLEAKLGSYGILALLGMAAMVFGSLILINSPLPEMRVHWVTAIGITLPFAAITIFLLRLVILSHQRKSAVGMEGMIGEIAVALEDFQSAGKVQVHGEIWQALSLQPVRAGDTLRVVRMDGLKVQVEKLVA